MQESTKTLSLSYSCYSLVNGNSMCPLITTLAQGRTHRIETHMEICLCICFFWPPPSSWQRQCLQSMETYSVSPATVTKQMINIFRNENAHTAKDIQMIITIDQHFSHQTVPESQSSLYPCQLSRGWQWLPSAHGQAHSCPHK